MKPSKIGLLIDYINVLRHINTKRVIQCQNRRVHYMMMMISQSPQEKNVMVLQSHILSLKEEVQCTYNEFTCKHGTVKHVKR